MQSPMKLEALGLPKGSSLYELEPAGEMPEKVTLSHVLVVCQGEFQASFKINGQWHQEQYDKGDIALFAAGELFPRVKTDREVPLIDLFLSPDVLIDAIGETASKVQVRSRPKGYRSA